ISAPDHPAMLWKKNQEIDAWVTRFTVGEDYRWDTLLLPYDIRGSRVQAWSLAEQGLLTEQEAQSITSALDRLEQAVAAGEVTVRPEDEDCHTVIELYLTQELGDVGKKIHTGRSRNDQVLVALRLFVLDRLREAGDGVRMLALALCDFGERYRQLLIPGYTHFQPAMPTTAGLWALGYAELLASDLQTLRHAHSQVSTSPLGSAAGYGAPYLEIPREEQARRLGFERVQLHVPAVQLSRGKLELEALHAVVQVASTLNRLASDLVLFNSREFGFVRLPARFCTGSSIMPQKQNPDVLELVRASYHRVLAEMNLLLTLPSNLPSGYHRDLQLTKEAVMRGCLVGLDLLQAMNALVPEVEFDAERAAAAITPELFATARALEKVRSGTPFRDAYREAASEIDGIAIPQSEEALAAYRVDGYPGRERPDLVRDQLTKHEAWLGR
ncbi:MAG TPA: argininosuccinate lyase, partial [Rhodothermales bacterium]